jgi:hypothetical protein
LAVAIESTTCRIRGRAGLAESHEQRRHSRADRGVAVGAQRHRTHRYERVREGAAGLAQVGMQPGVDDGDRDIVQSRPEVPADLVHLLERQRERCESPCHR